MSKKYIEQKLAEMPAGEGKRSEEWDAPLAGSSPGLFVELMVDGVFVLYM